MKVKLQLSNIQHPTVLQSGESSVAQKVQKATAKKASTVLHKSENGSNATPSKKSGKPQGKVGKSTGKLGGSPKKISPHKSGKGTKGRFHSGGKKIV